MSFYKRLSEQTADGRDNLLSAPFIQDCVRGEVSLERYLAFLHEAFHHVSHTVPLLRECKAALPPSNRWLREQLDAYIDEEVGHDQWILNDILAAGGNPNTARSGVPGHATDVMVAYAYDTIVRRNPLGLLGLMHVLESSSSSLTLLATEQIQKCLQLPKSALSYLHSRSTRDQQRAALLVLLVNQIGNPRDRADIIYAARTFYRLYGDVLRSLPLPSTQTSSIRAAA